MKKVICNVLYKATMPMISKEMGKFTHTLGLFEDERTAKTASLIEKGVLGCLDNIIYAGSSEIEEYFVPEDRMEYGYVQYNLVTSIEDFAQKNCFMNRYVSENGRDALQMIINNAVETIGKTEDVVDVSSK